MNILSLRVGNGEQLSWVVLAQVLYEDKAKMSAETGSLFKLWVCVSRDNKFAKNIMWKDHPPRSHG